MAISQKSVIDDFVTAGWTPRFDKYTNRKAFLEVTCPEGHEVSVTYDTWRKHHECPLCARQGIKNNAFEVKPKPRGAKRMLALDQATNVTGWAIFDDDKLIKYGAYTSKKATSVEKITDMRDWLVNMVAFWNFDRVILEDIQLQDNYGEKIGVTTFKTLAHLQGVLIQTLFDLGINCKKVHTAVWREYNGVKGRTRPDKKKSAQLIIQDVYGFNPSQDEADAICIGRYGTTIPYELELTSW